jgi:hypothetical protein
MGGINGPSFDTPLWRPMNQDDCDNIFQIYVFDKLKVGEVINKKHFMTSFIDNIEACNRTKKYEYNFVTSFISLVKIIVGKLHNQEYE